MSVWVKGAIAAFVAGLVTGGADAFSSGKIDKHGAMMAVAGGLVGLSLYLKQSPVAPTPPPQSPVPPGK